MPEFEKKSPNHEHNRKPELGSFAVGKDGRRKMRKDIFAQTIIDNERAYRNSADRWKAITDLINTWFSNLPKVELIPAVKNAYKDPDAYKDDIEKLSLDAPADSLIVMLKDYLAGFNKLYDYAKEIQQAIVDERLDFKDTYDIDLNEDLKSILEKKIDNWQEIVDKVKDLISYTEDKIEQLSNKI